MTTFIIIMIVVVLIVILKNIKVPKKSVNLSQDRSQNSQKDWTKWETHQQAMQEIFDNYGITVNPKAQEDQQEPTNNSKKDTYQIQFLPKKKVTQKKKE